MDYSQTQTESLGHYCQRRADSTYRSGEEINLIRRDPRVSLPPKCVERRAAMDYSPAGTQQLR